MKTSALLKLHQRQVDICDMVIKCQNYLRNLEPELKRCQESKDYYIGIWTRNELVKKYSKEVAKYSAIKNRLERYYDDIQLRINNLKPEKTSDLTETEENLLVQNSVS
jgi:hypothetical protein